MVAAQEGAGVVVGCYDCLVQDDRDVMRALDDQGQLSVAKPFGSAHSFVRAQLNSVG